MRLLAGPSALTEFEAARLLAILRAIDPAVTSVEAAFLYILQLRAEKGSRSGTRDEEARLELIGEGRLRELLGDGCELDQDPRLWIAPRTGTQSPWSSKATDILHNTGFTDIERIERARVVHVPGAQDLLKLTPVLHDRMTESIFTSSDGLKKLFATHVPKPLMPHRCARRWSGGHRGGGSYAGPVACARRDRLSRAGVHGAFGTWPQSDRC